MLILVTILVLVNNSIVHIFIVKPTESKQWKIRNHNWLIELRSYILLHREQVILYTFFPGQSLGLVLETLHPTSKSKQHRNKMIYTNIKTHER